eukprot:COSAG03_NODE_2554_length_2650_cov_2.083105_1_plen_137_part_00
MFDRYRDNVDALIGEIARDEPQSARTVPHSTLNVHMHGPQGGPQEQGYSIIHKITQRTAHGPQGGPQEQGYPLSTKSHKERRTASAEHDYTVADLLIDGGLGMLSFHRIVDQYDGFIIQFCTLGTLRHFAKVATLL